MKMHQTGVEFTAVRGRGQFIGGELFLLGDRLTCIYPIPYTHRTSLGQCLVHVVLILTQKYRVALCTSALSLSISYSLFSQAAQRILMGINAKGSKGRLRERERPGCAVLVFSDIIRKSSTRKKKNGVRKSTKQEREIESEGWQGL